MGKYSSYALRKMMPPLIALGVFAVMAIIGLQVASGKLFPIRDEISTIKQQQALLEAKLETLQQVDASVLDNTQAAYLSLPAENPGAMVLSQLRKVAREYEIALTSVNLTATDTSETELRMTSVDFKAEGTQENVLEFLRKLKELAPLINLQQVKVESALEDQYEVLGVVQSYWSDLPEALPTITDPATGLTSEEVSILAELAALEQPEFSELEPSSSSARQNPFSVDN